MPLKKHKLDNTRIFALTIKECDHPGVSGATAAFAYLDPFTNETKISSALFRIWGRAPSEEPLHTFVKFDGVKAWGADGVSRRQFDTLEALRRDGRLEDAEEMTYGQLRQRLLNMAEAVAEREMDARAAPEGP